MERGKRIWADEPCDRTEGHENIYAVWKRLFGERLQTGRAVQFEDGGDVVRYRMPNGYVVEFACDGHAIYEPAEQPTPFLSGGKL
jgi:hypothetical protein